MKKLKRFLKANGRDYAIGAFWDAVLVAVLFFAFLGAKAEFAHGDEPTWFEFNPAGAVDDKGILDDVTSHCDAQARKNAYEPDRVTYCHEATHQLDSIIWQKFGEEGFGAMYVGGGKCCVLHQPKITLSYVAARVPRSLRTGRYTLYLIGEQSSKNNRPLAILDEWNCYTNGTQAGVELGLGLHGSDKFMVEFNSFADCLLAAVKEGDPSYPQLGELTAFISWQKARVQTLLGQIRQSPLIRAQFDSQSVVEDLAPEFRRSNPDGSCVHCSTVMAMRWLGLYGEADHWWASYHGGESDSGLQAKLLREGLQFACTRDGDARIFDYADATRRSVIITWGGAHSVLYSGRVDGNVVLLDNNQIWHFRYQEWNKFLSEWHKCGGWAFVILSGEVPAPTPT